MQIDTTNLITRIANLAQKEGVSPEELLAALITRRELELAVNVTARGEIQNISYHGHRGRPRGWRCSPELKEKYRMAAKLAYIKRQSASWVVQA